MARGQKAFEADENCSQAGCWGLFAGRRTWEGRRGHIPALLRSHERLSRQRTGPRSLLVSPTLSETVYHSRENLHHGADCIEKPMDAEAIAHRRYMDHIFTRHRLSVGERLAEEYEQGHYNEAAGYVSSLHNSFESSIRMLVWNEPIGRSW